MNKMKNVTQLIAELKTVLNDPQNDNEFARAQLATLLVEEIYKFVKFNRPEGEGFDGKDGPERRGLGEIVEAAMNHEHEVLERDH